MAIFFDYEPKTKKQKKSDKILKNALLNYNQERFGANIDNYNVFLGGLKDIDRVDCILGAILDYIDKTD